MRICTTLARCAVMAGFLFLGTAEARAAEKLSEILSKSGWGGVIGTWVDAETQGTHSKATYAWKFPDRVIEITNKEGDKETVALMGVDAKTGKVFHMGVDSYGGSSIGNWELKPNGEAVLGLLYTAGDGQQGALSVRHRLEGADSLTLTIELPQPITRRMVRATPKK